MERIKRSPAITKEKVQTWEIINPAGTIEIKTAELAPRLATGSEWPARRRCASAGPPAPLTMTSAPESNVATASSAPRDERSGMHEDEE